MKYLLLFFLCFIVSCTHLKYGNVMAKQEIEPYTQTMLMPMYVPCGKTTIMIMVPYFIFHNRSWEIEVHGVSTKGKEITKDFYIGQDQYDSLKIGDQVCVQGLCDQDTGFHEIRK
jgi:hypothetical protein